MKDVGWSKIVCEPLRLGEFAGGSVRIVLHLVVILVVEAVCGKQKNNNFDVTDKS